MQKLATLALLGSLLAACGSNPLDDIKNTKIEGHNVTWAAAAENLSVCKPGTQQWQLQKENQGHLAAALFECELTDQAIAPYNIRLEENITQDASLMTQTPMEKVISANLTLKITASQEGNKPLIKIYPKFNNGKKKDSAVVDKQIIRQILIEDLNPIERVLPDPPVIHRKFNNQSIFP